MISFRYELEGAGWADAYLSDGTNSATIPASCLCDALRDLVDAHPEPIYDRYCRVRLAGGTRRSEMAFLPERRIGSASGGKVE
jgi:hypothetical protein